MKIAMNRLSQLLRSWLLLCTLFFAWALSSQWSLAHDGHEDGSADPSSRVWTLVDSGAHLHGSFVASQEGMVQIRRSDGQVVALEVAKLTALDKKWINLKVAAIRELNEDARIPLTVAKLVATTVASKPAMADSFEPFARKGALKYRQDAQFFYVESNSMPDHKMMVGITAWQQQVPIPQPYFGNNAWRIPLEPVVAKNPLSAKSHFFRGAIALAANGIPIFNPIKNDGKTDTLIGGELDEFGGHCGRADDYHYHIAPTHLQEIVGQDKPVAYALDGYAIYGYTEPDGTPVKELDQFNGHTTPDLGYHYHATKTRYVNYVLNEDGSVQFDFFDGNGKVKTETYSPRQRGPGGGGGQRRDPPPKNAQPRENRPDKTSTSQTTSTQSPKKVGFDVSSSAIGSDGMIPAEFTCDGQSASPPIQWTGAPAGTKSFALSLWHTAPDQEKSYWLVYNIPANVDHLDKNDKRTGTVGLNDKKKAAYEPMCSKGPGVKKYHVTIYALSSNVALAKGRDNRRGLLKAIEGIKLAETTLDFTYERKK